LRAASNGGRKRGRAIAGMTRSTYSEYYVGIGLIAVSAITFSTAGLFTKGVQAGAWEVIFWRGFFAAAFTTVWTVRRGALRRNFLGMGTSGLAIGVVGASGTAAFIPAFKLTTIANVSLIYAVAPLIAALLAWFAIGERVSRRTMAGCVGALLGVAVIVSGSLGQISLYGDLLALWMTIAMEVKDRSKDVIISGGENISSLEVEEVLYRHPKVLEAAVVARPDEKWGERPCAFVTLKDGQDATPTDIIAHCRENMAHFKAPGTVVFGPLPKTSTGKIQKFVLRDRAQALAD